MGTRSLISVRKDDGWYYTVYCHYDGYPSHNGVKLLTHYNSKQMAEALIDLGDLSYLDDSIACPEGHTFDHPVKGHTITYGRDRGYSKEECAAARNVSLQGVLNSMRNSDAEYAYIWTDGHWLVGKNKSQIKDLVLLSEVVKPEIASTCKS